MFVPLAKWSMLLAGNYRCVQKDGVRSIKDAVHSDLEAVARGLRLGRRALRRRSAPRRATWCPSRNTRRRRVSLVTPSSAARALLAGAPNIERVDRLVQTIAAQRGKRNAVLDETVALVDARLELNRKKA